MANIDLMLNRKDNNEELSFIDKILGKGIRSPIGRAIDKDFSSFSLSSDKINKPSIDDLFNRKRIEESPLGIFSGKDRLGSDGKELGEGFKKGLKRSADQVIKDGETLFGKAKEGVAAIGPSLFNSIASGLNDAKLRNIQGDLAVTETATSPFSSGSISRLFSKGAGGADTNADIREAILLDENRRRRDKQEKLRDSLFGLGTETVELKNKILKEALEEARASKGKR